MKRLIENTVRSALVTAWRRATWPTSCSPSLVHATTDGVVRLPSALGITTGSPPSRAAMTEFVVPRSMPTTLAMLGVLLVLLIRDGARRHIRVALRRPPGHLHQRRAPHFVLEGISSLQLYSHMLLGHRVGLHVAHRLVEVGIEGPAHRLDGPDAVTRQDVEKLAQGQADSLGKGLEVGTRGRPGGPVVPG